MKKNFNTINFLILLVLTVSMSGMLFADGGNAIEAEKSYERDAEAIMKNFDYIIGPEDVLEVFVWRHPDLSATVTVRPDGKISLPILDDVEVSGLTPKELDKSVTRGLSELIKDPRVTVIVRNFSSKKICVLGEVGKPGMYPLTGRLTIVEAIAMAAYTKNSAVLDSVILIRRDLDGTPKAMRVNMKKILKASKEEENILLQPNDVIFVPKSFISKLDDFLEFFTRKINPSIQWQLTKSY